MDDEGNPRIVNCNDFLYGVRRTLDPNTGSSYSVMAKYLSPKWNGFRFTTATRVFHAPVPLAYLLTGDEQYAAAVLAALRKLPLVDVQLSRQPYEGMSVLTNMASYIRTFSTLPEAELRELMAQAEQGVQDGTYLFCLPQFLVTGDKPAE